jgi:hypothetical protein
VRYLKNQLETKEQINRDPVLLKEMSHFFCMEWPFKYRGTNESYFYTTLAVPYCSCYQNSNFSKEIILSYPIVVDIISPLFSFVVSSK